MGKKEKPILQLEEFLPPNTFHLVAPYFEQYVIHLTLTRERKTVLGDYREPTKSKPYHRITINANLNPYNFLITLVHEMAHMITHSHFPKAQPHGKEWKKQFRHMLMPFIGKEIFPKDVEQALIKYMHNPSASTCTDQRLYKALYKYDIQKPHHYLVCDLEPGHWFQLDDGRVFEKIEHLRTRSMCKEISTKKKYFFPGIYEVKRVKRDKQRIA